MRLSKRLVSEIKLNLPFYLYLVELERILKGCSSVLDLGCGAISPIRFFTKNIYTVGVDGYGPDLERAKSLKTHTDYRCMDVFEIDKHFKNKSFDAVIMLDIIEHLKKEDGYRLIAQAEKIAKKKIIIFTPSGYLPQISENSNLQEHLSGWDSRDLQCLGFQVKGWLGLKQLRGQHHDLRRPKIFFGILSVLTHYFYTHNHPEKASALFAVKNL